MILWLQGEGSTVASQLETQWGVHPVTVWQLSWSVLLGLHEQLGNLESPSVPMHLKEDSFTTPAVQENPVFHHLDLLFFCPPPPHLKFCCSSTLNNTVQEAHWETIYLLHKLNVTKVWNCPTFSVKRFFWLDWRWPNYGEKTVAETVARILVTIHGTSLPSYSIEIYVLIPYRGVH